ncbi:MAG: ATP-binding cassette domain-containing protein [bacterium]|nr:ATP-binding cassette domain-containing protein [bacterium]
MNETHPVILLDGVIKRYEDDPAARPVLNGLSLKAAPGETLSVVGPSGSGKTTLLNLIGALDRPSEGKVFVDGLDLAEQSDADLARLRNRRIGFVFQLHFLLPQLTVLENVLLPSLAAGTNSEQAENRAIRLLNRVGLQDRLHYRPANISGGERQRAAVVRALINEPAVLLADEPTGSLDRASADSLTELLLELNREEGVALVVVTHAENLAERMGRVLELRDGRLIGKEPVS